MHRTFRPWYFPLLLLIGSLILLGISLSGCGSHTSSITHQCLPPQNCAAGNNLQNGHVQGQGNTIVETPVSKTALKSYLILSISDSLDSGRVVPDGAQLSIQLIPQGHLTNGTLGKTLDFKRTLGEDDIGLENIPPGTYTMNITGTDSGGKPLHVCLSYNDDEPAPSQRLALQHGLLGMEGQSATTVQLMMCPT